MFPFPLHSWPALGLAVVAAVLVGILVAAFVALIVRAVGRRRGWPGDPVAGARIPFRVFVLVALIWAAVSTTLPAELASWRDTIEHGFAIVTIASGAWFVAASAGFLLSQAMGRYRTDVPDNRVARRIHTQLLIVRRLVSLLVAILALGAILLTFPGVEAVGGSVLASAGLLSVVAGLAAQSTLANVFAGIQLAFSDALRVDDVVVVENEWGRIEEITLSYIVVHLWDDRRLVLPCTWFTTHPFQNWTRRSSELLGAVEFDLDWRVSPARMREELDAALAQNALWDGRVKVLQVTDAVAGHVRVRILVTAKDAPTLFDLRCAVREHFVEWLQHESPASLPVSRVEVVEAAAPAQPRKKGDPGTEPIGLFTGTPDAEDRANTFTAAVPIARPPEE